VKRIRQTGSLLDKATRSRARPVRSTENIAVAQSVLEQPSTSIRHRSQNLNISHTSLRRILNKDLGMKPYKVNSISARIEAACVFGSPNGLNNAWWFEDEHFYRKIIFFDEAHFHLGGYGNKQNCHISGVRESACRHGKADASTTSDCLV